MSTSASPTRSRRWRMHHCRRTSRRQSRLAIPQHQAIVDLNFVRSDGKTLIPQPHLRFDDKDMWTLDHVRGNTLGSPLITLRGMDEATRTAHLAEYRAGFTINPCN